MSWSITSCSPIVYRYYISGYLYGTISISISSSFSFSAWTLDWTSKALHSRHRPTSPGHRENISLYFCLTSFFWRRHLERCQASVWRNSFASVLHQLTFCQHLCNHSPYPESIKWTISMDAWIYVWASCSCHLPHIVVDEWEQSGNGTSENIFSGEL